MLTFMQVWKHEINFIWFKYTWATKWNNTNTIIVVYTLSILNIFILKYIIIDIDEYYRLKNNYHYFKPKWYFFLTITYVCLHFF